MVEVGHGEELNSILVEKFQVSGVFMDMQFTYTNAPAEVAVAKRATADGCNCHQTCASMGGRCVSARGVCACGVVGLLIFVA